MLALKGVPEVESLTAMRLSAGDRLGFYEILSPLGAGGMGEVYQAKDCRLGREVALKVLPDRLIQVPEALDRFSREAKTLASLSHPNIIVLHDVGAEPSRTDGAPCAYAVMELLHGETLRGRLAGRTINWLEAVQIAASVAEGLSAAHAKGIIHRDLKPENIFVTSDGLVKILDFGLARIEVRPHAPGASEASTVTVLQGGAIEGTIGYMSPEQLQGKPASTASDLFSLGCCLYEMIIGRKAFLGDSAADVVAATLKSEPILEPVEKAIPGNLRRIVARCLEKDPSQRFQSAHDLSIALREFGSAPTIASQPHRLPRRSWAVLGLIVLVTAVAVTTAWGLLWKTFGGGAITSLAVLPFTSAPGSSDTEYLSAGLTEILINSLSQVPQLTVMSLSTVAQYSGSSHTPMEVGRILGVQAVLTGRVAQQSKNLFVSVELVEVKSARNLWGERYRRRIDEILVLQDELAADISDRLRLRLNRDQQNQLVRRSTQDTEAYQLFLKGRYHWRKRTAEGTKRAIAFFEQAIAKDPEYALAWSGLADAWVIGELPVGPLEAGNRARAAALSAVRLDDASPDVHISLSRVRFVYDRNWKAAENEVRKALARNSKHAEAHRWYSVMLTRLGRMDEAEREVRRALELDPVNAGIQQTLASFLYWAGRFDEAAEEFRKILEMDPNSPVAHAGLGLLYALQGSHGPAVEESLKAVELAPGNTGILSDLGYVYAVAGRRKAARKVIQELAGQASARPVSSHYIGYIYAGLLEQNLAIEWLEKAYQEHSQWLPHFKHDPQLAVLRADVRFTGLLRRIGF